MHLERFLLLTSLTLVRYIVKIQMILQFAVFVLGRRRKRQPYQQL